MSVLGMLAWCAAAVSLWLGAREHDGAIARAYRWLAGAAALYCAGLIISQLVGGTQNPAPGLAFADLPPLLALAAMAVGIAHPDQRGTRSAEERCRPGRRRGLGALVLPGLADGYVMAVALLVIGWVTMFSGEFHRSGERPGTFLLALVHPLADLAVIGALLPHGHHRLAAGHAAVPVAAGHRRRRRAGGGPAGLRRAPGRRGAADARGRGGTARHGAVAGDRGRLDAPDRELGGGHDHRRGGRGGGHPGGDRKRPRGRARVRDRADRGGRRGGACADRTGPHARHPERRSPRDLAGIQPEPARPRQPDQ